VTGFTCDPHAGLLLRPDPLVGGLAGAGSLVKSLPLARNDARPKRWWCYNANTKSLGLFWAGADCHRCRQELAETNANHQTPWGAGFRHPSGWNVDPEAVAEAQIPQSA